MPREMQKRVLYRLTPEGYEIEVLHGIRVAQRVRFSGSREEAEQIARDLGKRHGAEEVREVSASG